MAVSKNHRNFIDTTHCAWCLFFCLILYCHVELVETSSRQAHIAFPFRYARSFDKLRMTRENANLPYKTKAPHFCGALYYHIR